MPAIEAEHGMTGGATDARWTRAQKATAVLAGFAVLVDGFDNFLLGVVIPSLAREFGLSPASFAPALAAGLFGMMAGSAVGGIAADRWGRKPALLASMAIFGVSNLLIAFISSLDLLILARAIGGFGLGITMPTASVLVAENSPPARRTLIVTLVALCIPLGAIIGGLAAGATAASDVSWRWLFAAGGALPMLLLPVSALVMVEPAQARGDAPAPGGGSWLGGVARNLLGPAVARTTALVWLASFANMLGLYGLLGWLPTLIDGAGYGPALAGLSISCFSGGGLIGPLVAAPLTARFGGRAVLAAAACIAAAIGAALAAAPFGAGFPAPLMLLCLTTLGMFGGGFNVMLIPFVLGLYPAAARTTGAGAMLAIGRIGGAVSPFAGIAAMTVAGERGFFLGYAAIMALCTLAILNARARPRQPDPE